MISSDIQRLFLAPLIFFLLLLFVCFIAKDWGILIISLFIMIFGPLIGLVGLIETGTYYDFQFKIIFILSLIFVIKIFILSFRYKEKWWAFLLFLSGLISWFIFAAYSMGPMNVS